jgi:hypothetical protein
MFFGLSMSCIRDSSSVELAIEPILGGSRETVFGLPLKTTLISVVQPETLPSRSTTSRGSRFTTRQTG